MSGRLNACANNVYQALFPPPPSAWVPGYEGSCCTNKTLPRFRKELPNPTSDDIEVRICGDEGTETEVTPVEVIENYVQ